MSQRAAARRRFETPDSRFLLIAGTRAGFGRRPGERLNEYVARVFCAEAPDAPEAWTDSTLNDVVVVALNLDTAMSHPSQSPSFIDHLAVRLRYHDQ